MCRVPIITAGDEPPLDSVLKETRAAPSVSKTSSRAPICRPNKAVLVEIAPIMTPLDVFKSQPHGK